MASSTFFFSDLLSGERLGWVGETLRASRATGHLNTTVFLTGDALYSLVDARTRDSWRALAERDGIRIVADGDELELHGLQGPVASGSPWVTVAGSQDEAPFWQSLVSSLAVAWKGTKEAGFLLCEGPYMSRVTVYMVRFLSAVQAGSLSPELYTYLDGVHALHNGQRPSEFENIGRAIAAISASAVQAGRDPWFAACSRCATARGYYQMNPGTGFCEPASAIEEIAIRPLKEILSRFSGNLPVVSSASGDVVPEALQKDRVPRLVIFIARPPYCAEWTFGGLSLALAAAMGGIPATVVFIEDGVYALHGSHQVPANDKVFNVQEMIAVTTDVPDLEYFVHGPSLEGRGVDLSPGFPMIPRIGNEDLARELLKAEREGAASRLIFF